MTMIRPLIASLCAVGASVSLMGAPIIPAGAAPSRSAVPSATAYASASVRTRATTPTTPTTPMGVTLAGLDSHDGTIVKDGDTYLMVGTRYACGYQWQDATSPFCGFGLWTASALSGPWAYQGLLFNPDGTNTMRGEQWRVTCNTGGNGCFNPRVVRRWDGLWLLYFNAPAETTRGQTAGYYVMGCNSLAAGGCGADAGSPHGSTYRMPMGACHMGGDFTVVSDSSVAYLVCSTGVITVEQLDYWWTAGAATASSGAVRSIGYLTAVESPGMWRDPASGMWTMTFADPQCGYCSGTGTGFVVAQVSAADTSPASTPLGVWLGPNNPGWGQPANGRRLVSGTSCGGQPRTVFVVDGQPYQWIDLWYGATNEQYAQIRIEPLIRTGEVYRKAADGSPLVGAFQQFTCG